MYITHIFIYISVSMYLPSAMLAPISTFTTITNQLHHQCLTLPVTVTHLSLQAVSSTAASPPSAQLIPFPLPRSLQPPLFHEPHCHPPSQHLYSAAPLPLPPCRHRNLPAAPPGSTVPATSLLLNHYLTTEMPPRPLLTVTTVTTIKNIQINNNRVSFSEKLPTLYGDQTWASSSVS